MAKKTIIFDLGGVLVDLDWDSVCDRLQEQSGLSDVRPEIASGPIVMSAMLGHLTRKAYHKALCERLVSSLSYEEFVCIWNGLLSANKEIEAVVKRLKLDYRLVLGSNTDPIHFASAVERFSVLENFERYFLSYEMGLLKPDPAFFHHILRTLDTPATDCVFIDDRAENVEAARKTGIVAVRYEDACHLRKDLVALL